MILINDLCLNYLEFSPPGSQKREAEGIRPLILFLHGRAANEVDLFDLAPQLEVDATVLSVRACIEMGVDSYGWFYTSYPPGGVPVYDPAEVEAARTKLLQFIHEAQEKYKTPPAQTYCLGFSQGAIMAYSIALHYPNVLAGIVAMSGRILSEHAIVDASLEGLSGFPILVSHGTEDEVLNIEYARAAKKILQKLPVQLDYFEHPMGHDITDVNFIEVKRWFLNQKNKKWGRSIAHT